MLFLKMMKQENAYNPWDKLLKMLQRNLEFQGKLKIKWQYKVIKKLIELKKQAYLNVIF